MEENYMNEFARQEALLRIKADLVRVEEDRRNGVKDIPVEEVIVRMKESVDANRRKAQNG